MNEIDAWAREFRLTVQHDKGFCDLENMIISAVSAAQLRVRMKTPQPGDEDIAAGGVTFLLQKHPKLVAKVRDALWRVYTERQVAQNGRMP